MANLYAFRSGQMKLVRYNVDADTVIEKGDMLWFESSDELVAPADDFPWDTNIATTQAGFADVFAGIANEPSAAGESDPISVDISPDSVYEMPCASAAYVPGATLGPDKASGDALLSQTLEGAASASSVARVVEQTSGAVTKVRVQFASAHSVSSNNANSAVG